MKRERWVGTEQPRRSAPWVRMGVACHTNTISATQKYELESGIVRSALARFCKCSPSSHTGCALSAAHLQGRASRINFAPHNDRVTGTVFLPFGVLDGCAPIVA